MSVPLAESLHHLAREFARTPHLFLFCDFDGTLVSIQERPEACYLFPETRLLLEQLAAIPQVRIGIISGRSLRDLMPRVGISGLTYAGNHGLEMLGPEVTFHEPTATARQPQLDALVAQIVAGIDVIPGAWVEHKGLSASLHFRQVVPEDVPRMLEIVQSITMESIQAGLFVLRRGKAVLEVRPAVEWHKGTALLWLIEQWSKAPTHSDALRIYLGDDETDEDAFRALPDGITIGVGERRPTAAKYQVRSPEDVHAFLGWLRGQYRPETASHSI